MRNNLSREERQFYNGEFQAGFGNRKEKIYVQYILLSCDFFDSRFLTLIPASLRANVSRFGRIDSKRDQMAEEVVRGRGRTRQT